MCRGCPCGTEREKDLICLFYFILLIYLFCLFINFVYLSILNPVDLHQMT